MEHGVSLVVIFSTIYCQNCTGIYRLWWHNSCSHAQLNNKWRVADGSWEDIHWLDWKGTEKVLKEIVITIRCDVITIFSLTTL